MYMERTLEEFHLAFLPLLPTATEPMVDTGLRGPEIFGSTVPLPITPGIDRQHTESTKVLARSGI